MSFATNLTSSNPVLSSLLGSVAQNAGGLVSPSLVPAFALASQQNAGASAGTASPPTFGTVSAFQPLVGSGSPSTPAAGTGSPSTLPPGSVSSWGSGSPQNTAATTPSATPISWVPPMQPSTPPTSTLGPQTLQTLLAMQANATGSPSALSQLDAASSLPDPTSGLQTHGHHHHHQVQQAAQNGSGADAASNGSGANATNGTNSGLMNQLLQMQAQLTNAPPASIATA